MENNQKNALRPGTLYLVATPIGNLEDISYRAVRTLTEADLIAAEDTRRTATLLNHLDIKTPLTSYFQHNEKSKGEYIVKKLREGLAVALVSDAGTPAISDPGEDLVRLCAAEGIPVVPVPGAVAGISGLISSGLSTGRFAFEGFLSVNKKSRREHLAEIKNDKRTLIFYEAPHKLIYPLKDMLEAFGDRRISVVRELTKIHEEVKRTTLKEAVSFYTENNPKGEFVLVLEGAKEDLSLKEYTLEDAVELAKEKIEEGFSASDAAKFAAAESKIKKGDIYRELNR